MGYYTIYDILTGNPGTITYNEINDLNSKDEKNNKKLYEWHTNVRVITKDGISDIGYYDLDGAVFVKTKKSILGLSYNSKKRYDVKDDYTNIDADGFLLNNEVYNILTSHKDYKKCINKNTLYTLISSYIPKKSKKLNPQFKMQQIDISDIINPQVSIIKKNKWMLVNPKLNTKDGKRNKSRIKKIVNDFIKFSCSLNNKNKTSKTSKSSTKSNKSTRKGPSDSATKFAVGKKKKGNDGNMWVVTKTKSGVKRWKRNK